MGYNHHKKEILEFIKQLYKRNNLTYSIIAKEVNDNFGTTFTYASMKHLCLDDLKMPVTITRNENYAIEVRRPLAQRYDKLGVIIKRRQHRQLYYFIKVSNENGKNNFVPLQKYVYEQKYGQIKKGDSIIFLDGDILNCNIENLRCVSQAELKKIQGNRYTQSLYGKGKITEAMLETIKTENLLRDIERKI